MDFLTIIFVSAIFLIIVVSYFLYVTRPKNRKGSAKAVEPFLVEGKWKEIEGMMNQGGPANYRQAIMEADKLVDLVLKSKTNGETMGERLKNAKHLFTEETYNKLWTAHKIRNKVAHEADFEGLSSDAILATRNFEKALKELKII